MSSRNNDSNDATGHTAGHGEVGYGKPPRSHQFKPGQSGNPRGGRKGAKNESTILRELLHRKINVREAGRNRKITVLEAIYVRFTESALKGDTKSAVFLFSRSAAVVTGEMPTPEISQEDRQILDDYARRLLAQQQADDSKP